jgi:hypothetical protein
MPLRALRWTSWKIWTPLLMGLIALDLHGWRSPAGAGPVAITASPISSFARLSGETQFGPFSWRGGITLDSEASDFGGLSGLLLSSNCEDMLAISDSGMWVKASLAYSEGRLAGIAGVEQKPMLDARGHRVRQDSARDAEAVTRLKDGRLAVAFERQVHMGTFNIAESGLAARLRPLPYPKDIDAGPYNGEIESLGQLSSGSMIAISERQRDKQGNTRGWIWNGDKKLSFALPRYDSYNVTDIAVLGDDTVLTLERRLTRTSLPGMVVRRFSAKGMTQGQLVKPELLLEAEVPLYVIDNMEGIALCERDGEQRVTFLSDNNFNSTLQSTVLLQFAYQPL